MKIYCVVATEYTYNEWHDNSDAEFFILYASKNKLKAEEFSKKDKYYEIREVELDEDDGKD